MQTASVSRRSFLATSVLAAGAAALAQETKPKIKVGLDNFSVRALQWKAPQLLDFAAQLKCDTLFISDIESYDSLEDAALRDVKKKADDLGIDLYAGGWSICPTSKAFKPKWGTAEEHLRTGIRVAKALGSPVYRVVLGTAEDRKTEGGIRARMADTVKVLKACRDTPKCSARAVTLTCAGSTISDFSQSPTWTASEGCILSAMIVLQIQIDQCILLIHAKSHAPVSRHGH